MNRRRATQLTVNRNQRRQESVALCEYEQLLKDKLIAMFPNLHLRAQAVKILATYQDDKPEVYRVRLAVLKLSEADLTEIQRYAEGAVEDYEDIINWAESPRQMKRAIGNRKLTHEERERLSSQDRKDFEKWMLTSR